MDPAEVKRRAQRIGAAAEAAAAEQAYGHGAALPAGQARGLRSPADAFLGSSRATDPRHEPVGLVLAGGGAKGAYQAGVIAFLAESGVQVVAVAGASIGALNGAMVAAAPTLAVAARLLVQAWREVAEQSGPPAFCSPADPLDEAVISQILNMPARLRGPMLQPGFVDDLLERYVDPADLRAGLPLYVSTFRAANPALPLPGLDELLTGRPLDGPLRGSHIRFGWVFDLVRSAIFHVRSTWTYVNDLPPTAMRNAILASAAIPVVMPPRNVGGVPARDGDVLGRGNLPVEALYGRIPCDRVIAIHLQPLPLFNPGEFPDLEVIEVCPGRALKPGGPVSKLGEVLDLSPRRVDALYQLGYDDARDRLGRVWFQDAAERVASFLDDSRRDAVAELGEPLPFRDAEGE